MSMFPRNRLVFVSIQIVTLLVIIFTFSGGALVIGNPPGPAYSHDYRAGDTVNPLDRFDFEQGDWSAWIVLSLEDRSRLPADIPNATVLVSRDRRVLQRLRNELRFEYWESDVATVTSSLLIYHGDALAFETGIVLEPKSEGWQNQKFGWLPVTRLGPFRDICKSFRRVWSPIVIL